VSALNLTRGEEWPFGAIAWRVGAVVRVLVWLDVVQKAAVHDCQSGGGQPPEQMHSPSGV
jgi:hypothetical protein